MQCNITTLGSYCCFYFKKSFYLLPAAEKYIPKSSSSFPLKYFTWNREKQWKLNWEVISTQIHPNCFKMGAALCKKGHGEKSCEMWMAAMISDHWLKFHNDNAGRLLVNLGGNTNLPELSLLSFSDWPTITAIYWPPPTFHNFFTLSFCIGPNSLEN